MFLGILGNNIVYLVETRTQKHEFQEYLKVNENAYSYRYNGALLDTHTLLGV